MKIKYFYEVGYIYAQKANGISKIHCALISASKCSHVYVLPEILIKHRLCSRLPEACVSKKLPGTADTDSKSSSALTTAALDKDYLRSDLITDIHFRKSCDVEMWNLQEGRNG